MITLLYVHPFVPDAAAAAGAPAFTPFVVTAADREKLLASMKSFGEPEIHSGVPVDVEVTQGTVAPEILDRGRRSAMEPSMHGR